MDTLRMELYQVEQDDYEPVTDYIFRVKDIEQRLLAAFEATNPEALQDDPNRRRITEDVTDAFLHGLKNPPEYQISVKRPTSLAEASKIAK